MHSIFCTSVNLRICIAKLGYEQYLAKYISIAEPSFNNDLPSNASDPQRYL